MPNVMLFSKGEQLIEVFFFSIQRHGYSCPNLADNLESNRTAFRENTNFTSFFFLQLGFFEQLIELNYSIKPSFQCSFCLFSLQRQQ
jgi:hypothetical protein